MCLLSLPDYSHNHEAILRRLESVTTFQPGDGCWLHNGKWQDGKGYKKIELTGIALYVHRVAWMILVGALRPSQQLDHKCKNRNCWRPDHLRPVTQLAHNRITHKGKKRCRKKPSVSSGDASWQDCSVGDSSDAAMVSTAHDTKQSVIVSTTSSM